MLGPNSVQELKLESFTLVTCSGAEILMPKQTGRVFAELCKWWYKNEILGFMYFGQNNEPCNSIFPQVERH